MQVFCVITAHIDAGKPVIDPPIAFWDREASYRYYREAGGTIPRKHGLEGLQHWNGARLATWHVVDVPDRKKYDREFVLKLVNQILDGELSQSEASRLYGPSQSRISEWVRTEVEARAATAAQNGSS